MAKRTLEGMALGGVYDQLAGGFHRYSVDERWCVPHFEKMSYDNSELLKNYLHGYQVTRNPLFRETAEGIIEWVNEVLSDRERGGFYASQDADQTLEDDGDYFTWTLAEVRAALSPEESRAIEMYYDVAPHGEMHHNPAKNVLWVARTLEDLAQKTQPGRSRHSHFAGARQGKIAGRAARAASNPRRGHDSLRRLERHVCFRVSRSRARARARRDCRAFALKTLDRMLAEAWDESQGFLHRIGGPPPRRLARRSGVRGRSAARRLRMHARSALFRRGRARRPRWPSSDFGDPEGGGFFDRARDAAPMGGLDVRRKPLQDSPTPGANSVAAMVLDRLYAFTGDELIETGRKKLSKPSLGWCRSTASSPPPTAWPRCCTRAIRCKWW